MKLIQLPFPQNSKGSYTKNLHYVLYFFKLQLNITEDNHLFDDAGFVSSYTKEVNEQRFGKATVQLVSVFQKLLNIKKMSGDGIDETTANRFNELLRQYSGLDIDNQKVIHLK